MQSCKNFEAVNEEMFMAFYRVHLSGKWTIERGIAVTGLTEATYYAILTHYDALYEKFEGAAKEYREAREARKALEEENAYINENGVLLGGSALMRGDFEEENAYIVGM